jgi:hypothetical protein
MLSWRMLCRNNLVIHIVDLFMQINVCLICYIRTLSVWRILSRVWVTVNEVCISDSIFAHFYTAYDYALDLQSSIHSCVFADVAWQRLPLSLGSRTITVRQLPASHSSSSQGLNPSSPLTTHQPTLFTALHSVETHSLRADPQRTPLATFIPLLHDVTATIYSVDDKIIDKFGAIFEMRIGWINPSTWRKLAQIPLCPP